MTLTEQQLEAVLNAIDGVDVSDRPSIGQAMQDAKNATLKALAGAEKERPRPRLVKNPKERPKPEPKRATKRERKRAAAVRRAVAAQPKEQPKPEPKRATKRERKRAAAVRRAVAAQPSGVARAPEPERRVARAVLIQPFIRRILAPFLEPVRAPEPKPKRAAVARPKPKRAAVAPKPKRAAVAQPKPKRAAVAQPKPKRAAVAQPKPKRAAVVQRVPWIDLPLARWANRHKLAPPKKLAAMPDREAGAAHEAEAARVTRWRRRRSGPACESRCRPRSRSRCPASCRRAGPTRRRSVPGGLAGSDRYQTRG